MASYIYILGKSGERIKAEETDRTVEYTYDALYRLTGEKITDNEGNVTEYTYEYDEVSNRTAKLTEAEKTYYLNDIYGSLTQVLEERDENGNVKCHYTRGEELISQEREGVISIYLTDGHGSVRQLSDIEGNVTDTYVYDAWGNMISQEGETENSYLYCGEQYDNATGLYYLRARYMNPQTGTFTSMDTYPGSIFDPVSLHKYLYANADPVMNVDPSGYFTLGELSVRNVIDKILDSQTYKNYLKTYQKMKNVLNVVNIMCTIYDIGRQIMEAALDPDSTAEDIIWAAARGIVTGVFINLMCKIKGLGPVLTKIFIAAGLGQQVQSIIHYTKEGKYDLAVTGTIELIIQLMSMSQTCFTGDTLVSTENGQKRIDEIEVGDKVWAYDIYTGKTELKEVLTVYVHDQDEILHLKTTAGDIDTTSNHPFYVMDKGWVAAGDLENGDEVYLIDGDSAVVTGSELEKLDEAIKVYNLEVEGYHTYYVTANNILVHNSCGTDNNQIPKIAKPEKVINELSDFKSQKWNIGGNIYLLDKKGMKHILTRHHPEFWDGSTKNLQSFFNKQISISDIKEIVNILIIRNKDAIADIGLGTDQISGIVNGVEYVLGFNKGRVGQLYPK